jgi:hypothetical protein
MTHDEWVDNALAARVEQLGQVAVDDPVVLDLIAEAAERSVRRTVPEAS